MREALLIRREVVVPLNGGLSQGNPLSCLGLVPQIQRTRNDITKMGEVINVQHIQPQFILSQAPDVTKDRFQLITDFTHH